MQRSLGAESRARAIPVTAAAAQSMAIVSQTAAKMARRPSRSPDYRGESRAFIALAGQMADNPTAVLQKVAELVVGLCNAGSAGISILDRDDTGAEVFRWVAVAGLFAHHLGGTLPRNDSPCGVVIEFDTFLLFEDLEERFPATVGLQPKIAEVMLAPFHVHGKAVGTVWALSHDPNKRFNDEDMRLLISVAAFASLRIFAPSVRSVAPEVVGKAAPFDLASLTSRQREILNRILDGQPNKNIAADLGISQRTAENHRAAIMKRMGASSVSALVQIAIASFDSGEPRVDIGLGANAFIA